MKPSIHFRLAVAILGLSAVASLSGAPNPQQTIPDELDLKTAIQFALENNFAIRQAQERIRQQEGVYIQIRSRDIPNVGLNYGYNQEQRSLLGGFLVPDQNGVNHRVTVGSPRAWQINLQVTQNIYAGGANQAAIRGERRTQEAAVLEFKGIVNQSLLQVRQQFYSVLLAQKKIAVQEESLALASETLKNVQNRYDAGTVSKFDLLRAQVAVANVRPPLITAKNDFRISVEQLRQALGFTNVNRNEVTKAPKFIGELEYAPTEFDLNAALESAHANRPELARFAKLEQARSENITQQRAGYRPNLNAVAGYTVVKDSTTDQLDRNLHGWILGVQGNWAIFDGAATRGRLIEARSLLEQAKLNSAEQTLGIDVEVRTAFSSWQEAVELVNASRATVDQATESLRLAESRFGAGSATQLDVLQSRVDLTQARTNEVQAFYTYNVAVATLQKAIGVADSFNELSSGAK